MIGAKLKAARKAKGLSMDALSTIFQRDYGLNVTKSMISRWENGLAQPTNKYISAYARYFTLDLNDLLGVKGRNRFVHGLEVNGDNFEEDTAAIDEKTTAVQPQQEGGQLLEANTQTFDNSLLNPAINGNRYMVADNFYAPRLCYGDIVTVSTSVPATPNVSLLAIQALKINQPVPDEGKVVLRNFYYLFDGNGNAAQIVTYAPGAVPCVYDLEWLRQNPGVVLGVAIKLEANIKY